MKRYRICAVVLIGAVCVFAAWTTPVRSEGEGHAEVQEAKTEAQDAKTEAQDAKTEAQPEKPGDPKAATTTKDLKIPLDELKALVKPLTLEELRDEAAGWMLVLQKKAKEISEAEVTVKRQNQSISEQREGADALEKAKQDLEEAEKAQKGASPGSPQYQEATKKVEEAQESLKKAQEDVKKAKAAKAELKQDEKSSKALQKAKETGDLETAKQTLNKVNEARDNTVAGSPAYADATKTIEKLEAAMKAFVDAQEAQKSAKTDSPEYIKATQQVEKAHADLRKVLQEIGGADTTKPPTEQSSQNLNNATAALENTKIKSNGEERVAGLPGSVDNQQNLQEKQQQLEKTTQHLQKSADAESKAKNQLVTAITELQSQLTGINDRFNVVLDELERKGGNAKNYHRYMQAVSSVEVDAKDTEGVGVRLLAWAKSEEGGLRWAGNIGKFVGIIITSIIISQILSAILNRLLLLPLFGRTSAMFRKFVVMVVNRGGIVIGFLLALTALEVSLGPVLALVGGVSFILAFALQSNLGNFASGLMIMAYKPFDVGDEIEVGHIWGWVDSITLASTRIEGSSGQVYNIPNNAIWSSNIENRTPNKKRQVKILFRVGFDEDLPKVEQLLVEIFRSHPAIIENPPAKSRVDSVEEYYILLSVRGWMEPPLRKVLEVRSDIIRTVRERFKKEGIKLAAIPTNTTIYVHKEHDGNGKTPHLVSEIPAHQGVGSISETPVDLVNVTNAEGVEV